MRAKTVTMINGATATVGTTTAAIEVITRAIKVSFQFIRADHDAGSSTFIVQVSNDGTNWYQYTGLITNASNTNAQFPIRTNTSSTLASDTSEVFSMDMNDKFKYMRVLVTEVTDGTHTATAHIQYAD